MGPPPRVGPRRLVAGAGHFICAACSKMLDVVRQVKRSDDDDHDLAPCVPFVPFRCPHCGRHKPFTYAVGSRLRYHRCRACGRRFRSLECSAASVRGWGAPLGPGT